MSINANQPTLEAAIKQAYTNAQEGGKKGDVIEILATEMAAAIHAYVASAIVTTSTTAAVIGIAAPLAPAGAAPVTGTALGAGTGGLS